MTNLLHERAELHDDTLLSQLDDLVRRDRCSCARIVAHLAEVDARELYLDRGAPLMIDYAKRVLGFSESAAYRRVTAGRLVRRFPVLLDRIASGAVHLTALTILGPHLDEENCERLVAAASGKSRLELEALVAPFRAPVPVAPRAVVRAVRVAAAPAAEEGGVGLFDSVDETGSGGLGSGAGDGAGRDEAGRGAEVAAAEVAPAPPTPPRLAYRLRRAVAERDGHRCTFVAGDGRRCPERGALEFHHRQAFAHGGPTTADNLTMLCAAHHRRISEQQFGKFLVRDEPRGGASYGNSRLARVGAGHAGTRPVCAAPRAGTTRCRRTRAWRESLESVPHAESGGGEPGRQERQYQREPEHGWFHRGPSSPGGNRNRPTWGGSARTGRDRERRPPNASWLRVRQAEDDSVVIIYESCALGQDARRADGIKRLYQLVRQ